VKRLAIALGIAVCAGCTAPAAVSTPQAQSRLADAEARAAALVRSGDLPGAARQYDEALRIAASIENVDAIAVNAVNLSIVQQWLGRDAEAREALSHVLDDPRRGFSERRRLQAELRRAILELAAHNTDAAASWAQRAERRCAELACDYAATILNLQAEVALAASRPADAARLASSAAERARARGDRSETANALRALGRARRAQGEPSAAIPVLEQALALDRELADPRKILADLTELSLASSAAGDRQAARDYYERALAVSRAVQDARGIAEMEAQLRRP
jgi:tetratricopeptide (TPR) repeat protein